MPTSSRRRILFVIRTKLGDTLVAFATVQAWVAAHPGDDVTLLVRKDYGELVARERGFRLVPFGSRVEMTARLLWLRLAQPAFDVLAVLNGYGAPIRAIARLVRARRKLYLDDRLADCYPEHPGPYHETSYVDRSWQTARLIDPHLPKPVRLSLPALAVSPAADAPIGIAPTADEPRRCLDRVSLEALLGELAHRHPGRALWVLAHRDDRALPESSPSRAAVKRFGDVQALVALLRQLGAWYGTDTGLYHLAVAMGLPATLFFGPSRPGLVVMPAQPSVTSVRLAVLGDMHCEEKTCGRPLCLHQAVANWCGTASETTLDDTPRGCPLRPHAGAALHKNTVGENPRHQA